MEKINIKTRIPKKEGEKLPLFFKTVNYVHLGEENTSTDYPLDKFYSPRKNKMYMTCKHYLSGTNQLISKIYSLDKLKD
ncbi:hypothetical protein CW751_11730 [Brumimicrobium salinarum]|uniref:Uncharacterized protein n=1 Tax=Brumimicrobium salinarum TaxID=2058658 RepID=A0A2I0R0B4_9FLAO|nr:hypothetical protein [Brumimicrobium salinarum]PKR80032.1 hypothetical protein CW751_11730 [Brumimicrobium salinarum]